MKQFLIRFVAFVLPVILIGLLMELALRKIPNDYQFKKQLLDQKAGEIEVLCLGSSHAYYDFNPAYIEQNAINASHVAQSFDFDLAMLKKYESRFKKLKVIVLPVSYFSYFSKVGVGIDSWRLMKYKLYYQMDVDQSLSDFSEVLNVKLSVNMGRIYKFYFRGKNDITCDTNGFGDIRLSAFTRDLNKTGRWSAERHKAKDSTLLNENVSCLEEIIAFAKKKNVRLVMFTPPAYEPYRQHLDSFQLATTINTTTNLSLKYPHVVYRNFLSDTAFKASDFHDADHLNAEGARKLTMRIEKLISSPKVTPPLSK